MESNAFFMSLPPCYGNLTKLRTLYLDKNYLIEPIPREWGGMAQLVELYAI